MKDQALRAVERVNQSRYDCYRQGFPRFTFHLSLFTVFIASFLALFLLAGAAQAAEISVRNPRLKANEAGYSLSANFSITFNRRLEDVVNKGVMLYFVADFELQRPRWYWLDEQVASVSRTFQLSYHALTRQYRLSSGPLHQSFASLDEAVGAMSQLRGWQVIDNKEAIHEDRVYQAALRLRLDLTQMPKTFQVSALSSRDWTLASDWLRWRFVPQEAALSAEATGGKNLGVEGGTMPGLKSTATPPLSASPATENAP